MAQSDAGNLLQVWSEKHQTIGKIIQINNCTLINIKLAQ
jgi:hypothetical protein